MNRPEEHTSSEHIDRLAQFFFLEFRRLRSEEISNEVLMKEIITELIEVFPDSSVFLSEVELSVDVRSVPIPLLWTATHRSNNRKETNKWWEEQRQVKGSAPAIFGPAKSTTDKPDQKKNISIDSAVKDAFVITYSHPVKNK